MPDIKPNSERSEGERQERIDTPIEAFRRSAGFQIMFVLHSGMETGKAIDHLCASAEKFSASQNAKIVEALKEAKEVIKTWHGPEAWEIYDQHSPEMIRLNGALEAALNPKG